MRRSFNGLYAQVQTVLGQDPLTGHLFVFTNRRHNRLKILYFDGSGYGSARNVLRKGRSGWPKGEGSSCSLGPGELQQLLHGLEGAPRRHWYRRA
jgi:transposase